jgi:diacylglycerol kinase family enzyme
MERTARRAWLARGGVAAAAGAVAVLLAGAGLGGSLWLVAVGVAGLAVTLAAGWWFLSRRGWTRWLALALALAAPVAVVVAFIAAGLLAVALTALSLWTVAASLGAAASAPAPAGGAPPPRATPPPRRPVLFMNPRSGGGKVDRYGLVESARARGARVVVLTPGADLAALARAAVADGADLLGVAGGDGTQAIVADVAAGAGLPFLVLAAGTRNHLALDLGLDRTDPARGLDALADGVELRIDLGTVNGRPFVNTVSFGAYAEIVQSPGYRASKLRTTVDLLPGVLAGDRSARLVVRIGGRRVVAPRAVLVSNNPYAAHDLAAPGRRTGLDSGRLGVLAVTVDSAGQAAALVWGRRAGGLLDLTATEIVVEADQPEIPVGVDGEAVLLRTPVTCAIRPGVLRVRVPRGRPGAPAPRSRVDWRSVGRRALPTDRPRS